MFDKHLILSELENTDSQEKLDQIYDKYLGKNGQISGAFKTMGNLDVEQKKVQGQILSDIKNSVELVYKQKTASFNKIRIDELLQNEIIDISTPGIQSDNGNYTLLTKARREIEDIFKSMGFVIEYGNDVVSKYENFYSLNIPSTHPATEMHDTFYLNEKDSNGDNLVMRTHTSSMQNILIKQYGVPLKIVVPGKVYRYESTDASHDSMFRQLEGMVIDKDISISNFKEITAKFLSALFDKDIKVRMRPGFFPFVEPGFEIDASCPMCDGVGCSFCKHTGWSEILGAGMIHPYVLKEAGIDPEIYRGFAFGMGLTRLVAVKFSINDVRLFTNNDLRFIKSF